MAACVLHLECIEASVRAVLYALSLEPFLQKLRLCVQGLCLPGVNSYEVVSVCADKMWFLTLQRGVVLFCELGEG